MKIGFITGGINSSGGAERVMTVLANAFSAQGHDVVMAVLSANSKPFYSLDASVKYVQAGKTVNIPFIRFIHKSFKVRRTMISERPDVIISFMTPMNCWVLLLTLGLRVPVFVSERVNPALFEKTILGKLRSLLYPLSAGIICQTTEAKDYFQGKFYDKCVVIPNPVTKRIIEKKDYQPSNKICAIGRLVEQKNYPFMIKVFAQFHETHPDYELQIFGNGELKDDLQELINLTGLRDKVILQGVSDELTERIITYDFFVMTSDYEGMSNALAEAMAAGLPCIATNCAGGGASALVRDKHNGFLISIGDEKGFVDIMNLCADDLDMRRRIGQEAVHIIDSLSVQKITAEWFDMFQTRVKNNEVKNFQH